MSAVDLHAIAGAVAQRNGMPRVAWDRVFDHIDATVPADARDEASDHVITEWLALLAEHLGGGYLLTASENFKLLHDDPGTAPDVLRLAERARDLLIRAVGGADTGALDEPLPLLVFSDVEDLITYGDDFHREQEGAFGTFAGQFVRDCVPHITALRHEVHGTLAHELAHAAVARLPLPLWVDEGLAMIMEQEVLGESWYQVTHELVARHRAYWSRHGLGAFWEGEAFSRPDDGQELSYHLAETLMRNILMDDRESFFAFLRAASLDDDGAAAADEHLGATLDELVRRFLGDV